MSPATLIRWGGVAAMLGGTIWLAAIALYGVQPEGPPGSWRQGWFSPNTAIAGALALIFVGVLGIHACQRARAGRLGRVAVVVAALGLALLAAARLAVDLDLLPAWPTVGVSFAVFFVGLLLLGASIIHAGVLPRAAGGLLILGILAFFIANFEDASIWFFLLFGAAWVWLGYALWSGRGHRCLAPAATSDAVTWDQQVPG